MASAIQRTEHLNARLQSMHARNEFQRRCPKWCIQFYFCSKKSETKTRCGRSVLLTLQCRCSRRRPRSQFNATDLVCVCVRFFPRFDAICIYLLFLLFYRSSHWIVSSFEWKLYPKSIIWRISSRLACHFVGIRVNFSVVSSASVNRIFCFVISQLKFQLNDRARDTDDVIFFFWKNNANWTVYFRKLISSRE